MPGVSPPRDCGSVTRLRLRIGALRRGRPAGAAFACWLAVAIGTFTVTAFPPQVETPGGFSLSQRAVSDRCQPPRSGFANSGCVRPRAVGTGELFAPVRIQNRRRCRQGAGRANCTRLFSGCPELSRSGFPRWLAPLPMAHAIADPALVLSKN